MTAENNIDRHIKDVYLVKIQTTTNPELDERILHNIDTTLQEGKVENSPKTALNMWRIIMKSRITKLAATAAIIITVLVGIEYFGGSIDMATPTFAEVIRPFLGAHTATFTITTEGPNDQPSFSMKGMFAEPGRMRYETTGVVEMVQIIDMQKGKFVSLMPKEKTAMVIEMANMPIEKKRKANMFFDIRRQLQQAQNANNGDVEFLGERQIDGINTDGYLLREELGIEMTVWIDAESLLPVRIEYDMSEMFGKQMKTVMSDFEFNVELDESLFSLERPEGYPAMDDATRKTLTDFFEPYNQQLYRLIDEDFGWN